MVQDVAELAELAKLAELAELVDARNRILAAEAATGQRQLGDRRRFNVMLRRSRARQRPKVWTTGNALLEWDGNAFEAASGSHSWQHVPKKVLSKEAVRVEGLLAKKTSSRWAPRHVMRKVIVDLQGHTVTVVSKKSVGKMQRQSQTFRAADSEVMVNEARYQIIIRTTTRGGTTTSVTLQLERGNGDLPDPALRLELKKWEAVFAAWKDRGGSHRRSSAGTIPAADDEADDDEAEAQQHFQQIFLGLQNDDFDILLQGPVAWLDKRSEDGTYVLSDQDFAAQLDAKWWRERYRTEEQTAEQPQRKERSMSDDELLLRVFFGSALHPHYPAQGTIENLRAAHAWAAQIRNKDSQELPA